MQFKKVYTCQKELTHKDFLRALLVKLASHSDTPYDVCDAKFGDVKESVKEIILCKAHVECDYTASIGYDRKEEYWDKERKYNSDTKQYYYEDVKKTRTVTDWSPHSGHIAGDATCVAFNEDPARFAYSEHERLREVILSIKNESLSIEGTAEVSNGGLETAKRNCAFSVELGIDLPGDRHKDERKQSAIEVKEVVCYKLPFYEVDFIYDGNTYHASGFACGKPNAESELPPNNVDIEGSVDKEMKPFKIGKLSAWIATPVLFIVAIIIAVVTGASWPVIFTFIALAAAITLTLLHKKKRDMKLSLLRAENKLQKLNHLKSVISAEGYAELTNEELNLFN